jgi:hypothetical protein
MLSNSRRPLSPIAAEARSPAVFACVPFHRDPAPGDPGPAFAKAAGGSYTSFLSLSVLI